MSQITNKRIYYISSATALTGGTPSNFTSHIQIPEGENYDRITCLQAIIPVSYYLVSSGESFILKEGNTNITINVPTGNYNINSFSAIISNLMTGLSANSLTYTMTYNSSFTQNNNGLIYYSVNTSSIPISIITNSSYINEQLGFALNSTNKFIAGSGTSTLQSSAVVYFINESSIYIHSDLVGGTDNDILQEVYAGNSSQLSQITFLNPCPLEYSKKLNNNGNQTISISITDSNNKEINLNGSYNLNLTIMLYQDVKFYRMFEYLIKYRLDQEDQYNQANQSSDQITTS